MKIADVSVQRVRDLALRRCRTGVADLVYS